MHCRLRADVPAQAGAVMPCSAHGCAANEMTQVIEIEGKKKPRFFFLYSAYAKGGIAELS
jgi:hypothetical protein